MTDDLTLVEAGDPERTKFIQTWIPSFYAKKFADGSWRYRLLPWEKAIELGVTYAAVTEEGDVEGMVAMEPEIDAVKVILLAAAPWNHGSDRIRSGVGSALLSNAIVFSMESGFGGAIELASVPEAETFYQGRGFVMTGQVDRENLPIYKLDADAATRFILLYPPLKRTRQRRTG